MQIRARRIAHGLWVRLEWVLSAAAAPLAVVLMRQRGFEAGVLATSACVLGLAFTLFGLHHPEQWRALVHPPPTGAELPARVRAIFADQLARRGLDPARVLLLQNAEVEVARTRDVGRYHLVELHPMTAAGPDVLLQALFAHELAHVAHRDPLLKRALAGLLVPGCTLLAALSAALMEGEGDTAQPMGIAAALLASATLLPWAYACLQAVSFALELRADREAATLCGTAAVFDLLDCLDDGGQPYRLSRPQQARPPELVERETNRLLEELLYLLPSHPPTWERRRRVLALQRGAAGRPHALRDALPSLLGSTAPVIVALLLGAAAFQLAGPQRLRPLHRRAPKLAHLPRAVHVPAVHQPDASCCDPALAAQVDNFFGERKKPVLSSVPRTPQR